MTRLLSTITWLEYQRTHRKLWLLGALVAMSFLASEGCTSTQLDITWRGSSANLEQSIWQNLFLLAPSLFMTLPSQILGLFILFALPLRSRDEWENGHLQVIHRGCYSPFSVEFSRFIYYCTVGCIFYLLLWAPNFFLLQKSELIDTADAIRLFMITSYVGSLVTPIAIALGHLVTATVTAYYHHIKSKVLTMIVFSGALCFMQLTLNSLLWWHNQDSFFPKYPINFHTINTELSLEPLLVSWGLTLGLLGWSSLTFKEMEY